MLNGRSSTANRTTAGRWTVAAALLASTMTLLAACGGSATGGSAPESSAPVIRADVPASPSPTSTTTSASGTASAVSAVASTITSGGVDVSWSGSGTGYVVEFRESSAGTWSDPSGTCALDSTKISAATTCIVTGLEPGQRYTFQVAPYVNGGPGTFSSSTSSSDILALGVPLAPVIVTPTATGRTTATVTFTAPTSDGGSPITAYTVTSNPAGGSSSTRTTAGTFTVTGLTPGTSYTFTVTATNTYGTSLPSAASATVTPRTNYIVGDTGPGGGKVFYVSSTGFACGPTLASRCYNLEVGTKNETATRWCTFTATLITGASSYAIGYGYTNTTNMQNSSPACITGAWKPATDYRGGGLSDWYLPSKLELNLLSSARAAVGMAGDTNNYWSSSQVNMSEAWFMSGPGVYGGMKQSLNYVRPVRAF